MSTAAPSSYNYRYSWTPTLFSFIHTSLYPTPDMAQRWQTAHRAYEIGQHTFVKRELRPSELMLDLEGRIVQLPTNSKGRLYNESSPTHDDSSPHPDQSYRGSWYGHTHDVLCS